MAYWLRQFVLDGSEGVVTSRIWNGKNARHRLARQMRSRTLSNFVLEPVMLVLIVYTITSARWAISMLLARYVAGNCRRRR